MTNHGCRFAWCTNDLGSLPSHLLEHFTDVRSVAATGKPGNRDRLDEVGILVTFDEDIEPTPSISLSVSSGRMSTEAEIELRPDEAILLYETLGAAIQHVIEGTNMDPSRVVAFYGADTA